MELLKNYIDGKWVEASTGQRFQNINPANGEVLCEVTESAVEDVDRAIEVAHRTFDQWRRVPAPKRAEILFRIGERLQKNKEDLAQTLTSEMGKVISEARGDVQEGIDMAFYMAGEGRRLWGQTTPSELPDKWNMSVRDPIGVSAQITPWNFPAAIPTWKGFPALVAGNTVVWKPATDTPWTAVKMVRIFEEAGLPAGVLNLVLGHGNPVGTTLSTDPRVKIVTFTGSLETGKKVALAATETLKKVHLELGGKNAITVLEDADLELAVDGIIWSAFGTSGQRCTATSRVIVHKDVHDALLDKIVARTKELRLGDGLLPSTDVGPVINAGAVERIHSYVEIGKQEGAELVVGGEPATEGELAKGFFYKPTIFDKVKHGMRISREEIFGPVLSIIEVSDIDEAIRVNNDSDYGLSSSLYTRDVNRAFKAMRELTSGIVYINAGTIGAEIHLPFGGTRGTGNGHREAGQAAFEVFTEWKSIYVDFSGRLQRAQIDNQ